MGFCTAINCMDGRTQLPVIDHLRRRFDVPYVDMITEAGPARVLGRGEEDPRVRSILARCDVSVDAHASVGIAVVGHHDCAGDPAGYEEQRSRIEAATDMLRLRYPGLPVVGLWVDGSSRVSEFGGGS